MSLSNYFSELIKKVESSSVITNQGKDKNGFFLPTKTVLLRHLNLLLDLHEKPGARAMVKDSWAFVVDHVPPEFLILTASEKIELARILNP